MSGDKPRRALVTGGAGFIGHHLVKALCQGGLEVTVLDDLSVGTKDRLPDGVRFIQGDVRDTHAVSEALEGVDTVFHLAAIVSVRASVEKFAGDADVNLMGTLCVLEAMADREVRRAIFSSSMAVYADSPTPVPLSEDSLVEPISPYGAAKLAAERYWHLLCKEVGIDATVLRYFNTYGPGQTPTPYVGVITIFIHRLLQGLPPIVFGDGEQRRDFIHVSDVVSATIAAMGAGGGGTFNVGTGHPTSVNDIARGLIAAVAPDVKSESAPEQLGEMKNAIAEISAISEALGWTPSRPTVDYDDVIAYWKSITPTS